MSFQPPFRLLDRSGRSLHWVKFDTPDRHKVQALWDSGENPLESCPRESKGQPQDITSHPCHSEGNTFIRLKESMRVWLADSNLRYQIEYRYVDGILGWYLGFLEKDSAMLFKLAWGIQ